MTEEIEGVGEVVGVVGMVLVVEVVGGVVVGGGHHSGRQWLQ